MKKRTRVKVVIAGIVMVLFFLSIFSLITGFPYEIQSKDDTVLRDAIVSDIEINKIDADIQIKIITEEYKPELMIPECMVESSLEPISNLKKGDRISFRVDQLFEEQFRDLLFIDVVSLKIEGTSVYTLEEYNTVMEKYSEPNMKHNIELAIVFFVIFICLFLSIRRDGKKSIRKF